MFLIIVLLLICILLLKLVIIPYFNYLKYRKYGQGSFTPIIGEITEMEDSLKKYNDIEYKFHHQLDNDQNQRVFVVNIGTSIKLRIFEPEIIKDFFLKTQHYVKDETYIGNIKRFTREGIVTAEGQKWKADRKLFSQAFHFDYIQKLTPLVEQITDKVLNDIVEKKGFDNFDPIINMQEITGRVIVASFFGEVNENDKFQGLTLIQALSHVLNTLGNQTFSAQYFIFGRKYYELGLNKETRDFNRFMTELDQYLLRKINEQIELIQNEIKSKGSTSQHSILAQIISSSQIDTISREQLFDDFKTFYLAGMDTTGHLLGMTLYYISQNKHIYQTLQKEIDNNIDQTSHGLAQLPYMNAVIKESLRYYGPGNILFDRIAISDHDLCGIPIKKGTIVTPFAVSMQRNSKFFEDPHSYNPSRWLDQKLNQLHTYAYIPFSAGQRNCIGQHLAYLETRIILNRFFKKFEFSCPEDYKFIMAYKFLAEPLIPIPLKLTLRKKI